MNDSSDQSSPEIDVDQTLAQARASFIASQTPKILQFEKRNNNNNIEEEEEDHRDVAEKIEGRGGENGEYHSRAILLLQKKSLEKQIENLLKESAELKQEQISLEMSLSRLNFECDQNRQLVATEQKRRAEILGIINKYKQTKKNKPKKKKNYNDQGEEEVDTGNGDDDDEDEERKSEIMEKLSADPFYKLQVDSMLQDASNRLHQVASRLRLAEEQARRDELQSFRERESVKKQIQFEKRWTQQAFQIENRALKDFAEARDELLTLNAEEERLRREILHVNREQEFLVEALERLIKMLQGREPMPNGEFVSVTNAIHLYSLLKKKSAQGEFSVDYLKEFLVENWEFGLFKDPEEFERKKMEFEIKQLAMQGQRLENGEEEEEGGDDDEEEEQEDREEEEDNQEKERQEQEEEMYFSRKEDDFYNHEHYEEEEHQQEEQENHRHHHHQQQQLLKQQEIKFKQQQELRKQQQSSRRSSVSSLGSSGSASAVAASAREESLNRVQSVYQEFGQIKRRKQIEEQKKAFRSRHNGAALLAQPKQPFYKKK